MIQCSKARDECSQPREPPKFKYLFNDGPMRRFFCPCQNQTIPCLESCTHIHIILPHQYKFLAMCVLNKGGIPYDIKSK